MKSVLSWLNRVLIPGTFIRIWMAIAAGVVLLLAVVLVVIISLHKQKKKKQKAAAQSAANEPITEQPEELPVLEISNLQGIGAREEQQDAFGLSHIDQYDTDGLLAVMCDGMGGMAEGGFIARQAVTDLIGIFPWAGNTDIPNLISQHSGKVYKQFLGHGGTTLVATLIKENKLYFWCVGDSDLFLLREGKLYSLNVRQEYKNELVLRAISEGFPIENAYFDSQAGALSEYIGKEDVNCDYNRIPFILQPEDTLMLCSDGISDTLTLKQIRESMALSTNECCNSLESQILKAAKPNQDNYTAILIKYHGSIQREGGAESTAEEIESSESTLSGATQRDVN